MQRSDTVRVVANDLEIYFKGFEVALKRKNAEDAVRYLDSMMTLLAIYKEYVYIGHHMHHALSTDIRNNACNKLP